MASSGLTDSTVCACLTLVHPHLLVMDVWKGHHSGIPSATLSGAPSEPSQVAQPEPAAEQSPGHLEREVLQHTRLVPQTLTFHVVKKNKNTIK